MALSRNDYLELICFPLLPMRRGCDCLSDSLKTRRRTRSRNTLLQAAGPFQKKKICLPSQNLLTFDFCYSPLLSKTDMLIITSFVALCCGYYTVSTQRRASCLYTAVIMKHVCRERLSSWRWSDGKRGYHRLAHLKKKKQNRPCS